MRVSLCQLNSFLKQLTLLALGSAMLCHATSAQPKPERFWLAGRYDGNRIIVYFQGVKFKGTRPSSPHKLAPAIAGRFFDPVQLPATYVAQFRKGPSAERFAIGDRYDLLLDYGKVATVTLTTLVGSEMDEEVGNDSFIGALATVKEDDIPYLSKNIFVLRPHWELSAGKSKPAPSPDAVYPGLQSEPVRFDIQQQILTLLKSHLKSKVTGTEQPAENLSPTFVVQAFRLADGTLRYYARAAWTSGDEQTESWKTVYALGAWITPSPTVQILALEERTSPYAGLASVLPDLRNVVDLGGGKTGIIFVISGEDSGSLNLVEYRDGAALREMRSLHSIGAGE
jgi:hypothetical protein